MLPVPYADTVLVPPMTRSVGHTGSGWALALHALGLRTHLVDLVGDDPEADFARRRFAAAGLSFGYAVTAAGTKRSVNLVDPAGARMSFYDGRGQALGDLDPFGAAFLAAWLRGAGDDDAARAGAVAGAWACSSYGSHTDPITANWLAASIADLAAGGARVPARVSPRGAGRD